jgi:hypothetical protein
MHEFYARGFINLFEWFMRWERISSEHIQDGTGDEKLTKQFVDTALREFLRDCIGQCADLELNESGKRISGATTAQLYFYGLPSWRTLNVELRVLRESIESELSERQFAFIPTVQAREILKLNDAATDSWAPIWKQVPKAEDDIRESVFCYVLERNTACVFHLMRVAEYCLRALASKLRVSLRQKKGKLHPIEFADWDKVITGCKARIDQIRLRPQGAKRQSKLELYSDTADHCLFMTWIRRIPGGGFGRSAGLTGRSAAS